VETHGAVDDVRRTAETARATLLLAEQFGEETRLVPAFGEIVSVRTVRAEEAVVRPSQATEDGGRDFLTQAKMRRTAHLPFRIAFGYQKFAPADPTGGEQDVLEQGVVDLVHESFTDFIRFTL
jgi:hypothetical protein